MRPLPGQKLGNSLAESWTESPDGLVYEFKLRRGVKFHNGEPVTAEDAKFSFERYKGAGATDLQARVRQVEAVDPLTLRIHLKEPWPDFMTFYGTTATAAGLVVPKKYLQQVGDDGFRKHPIGAGPYKFVSNSPGVEIVLEAYTGYWRRVPNVKRLVMKSVPEGTTRVAMLKKGEADIAYALDGEDAENVRRDPKLQLVPSKHASIYWIEFAEQWDPKSPWHDKRVRQAASYALDRQAINEASCLGFCPPTSIIIPRVMDFALQTPGCALRHGQGQAAAQGGRLPQRARRRRVRADPAVLCDGRGGRELPEHRRHSGAHPDDGAGRLPGGLAREEAARAVHGRPSATRAMRPRAPPSSSTPRAATPTAATRTSTT